MNASPPTHPVHICLIEDNADFRSTLQRAISRISDVRKVSSYGTIEACLAEPAATDTPDIVLLDVGLPGIDGIAGISHLKARAPQCQIVILTVFEDDEKIYRALCAGASGYLLKDSSIADLSTAVRDVMAGSPPVNPRVARRIWSMFSQTPPTGPDYGLAKREQEVLTLLAEGLTNKEIAGQMALSAHTVDTYIRTLYEKLQVNTRAAAVGKALKERLV